MIATPDVSLKPNDRASTIREYLDVYVRQLVAQVKRRQSCLLLGALGAGKTEVIQRAAIQLRQLKVARCVVINIGEATQLTPQQLWRSALEALDPSRRAVDSSPVELRAQVREWLSRQKQDLVLMLDQVELLERTGPLFDEIRAMVQDANDASDEAGRFIVVLSSTEALRRDLTSPHSPLRNILLPIKMEDCAPALRKSIWQHAIAPMPESQQRLWLDELDKLCAGDPYQILRVSHHLSHELQALMQSSDTDEQMWRVFAEIQANPAQVAPLLQRYGEQIENDAGAATLMLDLIRNKRVPVDEAPHTGNDSLWDGIFRQNDAGDWIFRSGLTERFFRNEFERQPERVASLLLRQQKFEEAIQHLAQYMRRGRDMTTALRDVCLGWVRTAKSPSRAWDKATRALSLWFGDGVMVLRCLPRWRVKAGQSLYMRVRDGEYDLPVEPRIDQLARAAYKERTAMPSSSVVLRPILNFSQPAQQDDCVIFPMKSNGGEYGAVVLTRDAYESEFDVAQNHDHLETWTALLNDVFDEIAGFEHELLSNVDLSSVQRLAQQHREPEKTEWVLGMILASITAGFGLKFNRCVLLQTAGGSWLLGRAAVGCYSQNEQERAWEGDIPATFEAWLDQYPIGTDLTNTPLGKAVFDCRLQDWRSDPVLGLALRSDDVIPLPAHDIARSALRDLLRIDGSANGDPSAFIVPLRNANELIGVLVLDKPFTQEPVTQEQLDLLPGFANQIALTLSNERSQRDFRLFDALNAATQRRLSLQETLNAIRDALVEHLGGLVTQLVISLWERSTDPSVLDPDRRQSTVRLAHSTTRGDLLEGDWQYFFYVGDERCCGPIDHAMHTADGRLHIRDVKQWLNAHRPDAGPDFSAGAQTIYSEAMRVSQNMPLGVISFQSATLDAFSDEDIHLFNRLTSRIASMVDKARVYESLSNARYHTDQLNLALDKLMQQNTRADLHNHIVTQVSDFFFGDGRGIQQSVRPDSAALFAMNRGELIGKVAGAQPELAEQLARECDVLRRHAITGHPVFIEYAGCELVAREEFGAEECGRHAALGANASVWCTIGDDLLLVLAWKKPRRISTTERQSLPVLTAIAARTNGVIERDRREMKTRLANSLSLGDYEMIEAEYTHQWNKRIRAMRSFAQFALEDMADANLTSEEKQAKVEDYLRRIKQTSAEGLERLSFSSKVTKFEQIPLREWLDRLVQQWNLLNKSSGIACKVDLQLAEEASLATRPAILQWIINELLGNALDAELRARNDIRSIELRAAYHPHRREFEIAISNNAKMPRDVLDAVRTGNPVDRPYSSGRGIWIAAGQVQALLAGTLTPPDPQDAHTTFTLTLTQQNT